MEYTVNKLAQLSGVSTRTLRYYDQIGLLKPERVDSNGYRIYGQVQVDKLQQILVYRELGVALEEIKTIIAASDFDRQKSLEHHLTALQNKKEQIEKLIQNVYKTICSLKGDTIMSDEEKFEGFKNNFIEENRIKYGKEVIEKYGLEAFEGFNFKVAGMTQEQWNKQEMLSKDIMTCLAKAIEKNDPSCEEAQKACDLHRQWLCMFWKDGTYSKAAHISLGKGYVLDERFKAFYDGALGTGAAEFFRDAIAVYTK